MGGRPDRRHHLLRPRGAPLQQPAGGLRRARSRRRHHHHPRARPGVHRRPRSRLHRRRPPRHRGIDDPARRRPGLDQQLRSRMVAHRGPRRHRRIGREDPHLGRRLRLPAVGLGRHRRDDRPAAQRLGHRRDAHRHTRGRRDPHHLGRRRRHRRGPRRRAHGLGWQPTPTCTPRSSGCSPRPSRTGQTGTDDRATTTVPRGSPHRRRRTRLPVHPRQRAHLPGLDPHRPGPRRRRARLRSTSSPTARARRRSASRCSPCRCSPPPRPTAGGPSTRRRCASANHSRRRGCRR